MLADEADNPGFLLLLEQVVLFVVMIMMALVMVIMMVVLTVGNSKGKRGPRSMQQKNRVWEEFESDLSGQNWGFS